MATYSKYAVRVGAVGSLLLGGLAVYLWTTDAPSYGPGNLHVVKGAIAQVSELGGRRKTLRLDLVGEPLPFCSSHLHRSGHLDEKLPLLRVGSVAEVAFALAELESPRNNLVEGIRFREIRSLAVDGTPILTLQASNESAASNHKLGRVITPIMATIGVLLLAWGIAQRRTGR